ncbi:glycosyltransferase, partial [bacterium]|nr:glycosyltransferase [bacterium]
PPCLRERIFVIPNAKRPFSSEGEIPQGRKPKILCVGRLVPQKDYLTALRAFSDVAALYPSWMLQIVGSGPEQARLEERVRALQLEARVEFVPFQHDLLPFYLEASVLLSTSRYEGFPNVILEAMSFGLPIVATDCPGATQELVTDGVQGELVPVGDLRALRVALRRVLDSESLRRSMGENGKKAAQRYDHSTIMSRWNMLFSL